MLLGSVAMASIMERLTMDFGERFSLEQMASVLRDCADSNPSASAEEIEQVTRLRLQIGHQGQSA